MVPYPGWLCIALDQENRSLGLVDDHPHKWPMPLQALEHKQFRLLWLATFVSNAGSWMQRVAAAWLVYTLSGSETWLGIDAAMAGLPTLLLLPFAGVLADRTDRRRVLLIANAVHALLAVLLAVLWWVDALAVWQLLGVSFVSGLVAAIAAPASQSVIPTAAGEDHIPNAVALNSFQYNVARAVGPALGGLALAWWGAGWCFLLNALSFLGMIGALTVLRTMPSGTRSETSSLGSLGEGVAFLRSRSDLCRMLILVALIAFGGAPMVTLLPAVAKTLLDVGATGYSTLLTSFGVGAAIAGLLLIFFHPAKHAVSRIVVAAIVVGICHVVMAWANRTVLAVGIAGIAGMAFVGAMIELGTELLSQTPDALRGRISGVQQLSFRAAQPLGGLLASLVAGYAGLQTAFVVFGAVLSLGAAFVFLLFKSHRSS